MHADLVVDQIVDLCVIPTHVDKVPSVMWDLIGLVKQGLCALARKICLEEPLFILTNSFFSDVATLGMH